MFVIGWTNKCMTVIQLKRQEAVIPVVSTIMPLVKIPRINVLNMLVF